jgi:Tol biopolymer transport system component
MDNYFFSFVALITATACLGVSSAAATSRVNRVGSADPYVVFAAERDGDLDVFAVGENGRGTRGVTKNSVDDLNAVASPRGDRVAVSRAGRIFVVDTRTGRERAVAFGEPQSWSPDGRRLAFGDRGTGRLSIVDGRGRRRTFTPRPAYEDQWSPDGTRIAFSTDAGIDYILDVRSGRQREVPNSAGNAVWSARNELAYADIDGGLTAVDASGRHPRRLAYSGETPRWSPDGQRLAYISDGPGSGLNLYLVGRRGGRARRLVRREIENFAWSPDGGRLAFTVSHPTRAAGVVRLPGGRVTMIGGPPPGHKTDLMWAPSGNRVAFAARGGALVVAAADASPARVVARGRALRVLGWGRGRVRGAASPLRPVEIADTTGADTTAPISELSADGPRVAFLVAGGGGLCTHADAWNSGRLIRFRLPRPCTDYRDAFGHTLFYGIKLKGVKVTWHQFACGNDCYDTTFSAALAAPRRVRESGQTDLGGNYEVSRPARAKPQRQVRGDVMMEPLRRAIRLRRTNGRTRVIRVPGSGVVGVELSKAGLFYAFNLRRHGYHGHLRFVPLAQLFLPG